jgi:single-stranded DNA-binding protein
MTDINTVTLTGTLAKDPATKTVGDTELTTANLSFAVKRKDGTKEAWIDVDAWGESPLKAMHEGEHVLVEGSLDRQSWKSKKSGEWQSKHSIRIRSVQALGPAAGPEEAAQDPVPF